MSINIPAIYRYGLSYYNLSIIIPVYNEEKYIEILFKDLEKYFNYNDVEVIVVNDGSNDNSNNILEKLKEKPKALARKPQEPIKPYPYREEDVSFKNNAADITLAGTFTKPNAKKKYPVVILITGSGPQDRDQTFSGHKTFLVLADYLLLNRVSKI